MAQIEAGHPDKRVEAYFQDEAGFGQQGTLARGWAKRGKRFAAVRQTKYDWLYVIGAACPRTGHAVGMLSPYQPVVKVILAASGSFARPLRRENSTNLLICLRFRSLMPNKIPRSRRRSTFTTDCYISVEVMNIFLEQFTREIPDDVHVVMVWDQAGFHTGNALKVLKNITIISLPPYSPELNPMENLWHYLRSHYWSNRIFGDYGGLCDAA